MASLGSVTGLNIDLPPRRKREPRKLSYLSCTFCRKSKVKCAPEKRTWPTEKCRRCVEKNLDCSSPQRKTSALEPNPSSILAAIPAKFLPIDENNELIHDALLLLGVQHILSVAVKELLELEELKELNGGTIDLGVTFIVGSFEKINYNITKVLTSMPHSITKLLLLAALELGRFQYDLDIIFDQYADSGDHGIVYAIATNAFISRSEHLTPKASSINISRIVLLETWGAVFRKHGLDKDEGYLKLKSAGNDLLESQLFLPKGLLRIPEIMDDVIRDGRKDCFGRLPCFMGHDVDLHLLWPSFALTERDCLGRSAMFLACSREDYALLDQILAISPTAWISQVTSDPFPLHAAAKKGYTTVFSKLKDAYPDEFINTVSELEDYKGCICLHMAARYGHQDTVDFLCRSLRFQFNKQTRYLRKSALHLATLYGHVDVVECLIRYIDPQAVEICDRFGATSFFLAAQEGHLDILRLLERYADVNHSYKCGYTPLYNAVSGGHLKVVEYLLSLNLPGNMRVNINQIAFRKTALDCAIEKGYVQCEQLLRAHKALRFSELQD